MNDMTVRRISGMAAVTMLLASVATIPLYFIYPGPPPVSFVLTRGLLGMITMFLLPVFVVGLAHLTRRADRESEFLAALAQAAGLVFTAVLLVGVSMEVGGVLGVPDQTVDPTVDGPLAMGTMLIHGSIGRGMTVVYLVAASAGAVQAGVLPRWVGVAGYALAAINLAFVPSLFFGTDATRFYSAIGWGNTALVAGLIVVWMAAAGVALLRGPQPSAARNLSMSPMSL